jgi:Fe-S-cluster-containing hydrogenase component 2
MGMIALDLDKCYECKKCLEIEPGLYSLIERGIRVAVCRHCVNAPCINACPVEALERPEGGDLIRYNMKCISCKQCANACPVGANPVEILKYRTFPAYKLNVSGCIKVCKEDAVQEVDKAPEGYEMVDGQFAVHPVRNSWRDVTIKK